MKLFRCRLSWLGLSVLVLVPGHALAEGGGDGALERKALESLAALQDAPMYTEAEGYAPDGDMRAVFFDGVPYRGRPTRVFAWLGVPSVREGKIPGVVLVHGGGGTAFKEWVRRWNEHGYAAISIAVEGQTDVKDEAAAEGVIPTKWRQHADAGPFRNGIYGDSLEPIRDQWMYHAVGASILAHSLLRSLPEVDPKKTGIMGVSWGGVITSTAIGIDTRFSFAIPVYGCGHLHDAGNQYGRSLGNNSLYRNVYDPVLRLHRATMPVLWFSWPGDKHFPLDCQAATYRASGGPRSVLLIPGLGHGHQSAWNRPEGYAFADAVIGQGRSWYRMISAGLSNGTARAVFTSDRPFEKATLVATMDAGLTGDRTWTESAATLSHEDGTWVAQAPLPEGATGWFLNLQGGELVASSDFMEPGRADTP